MYDLIKCRVQKTDISLHNFGYGNNASVHNISYIIIQIRHRMSPFVDKRAHCLQVRALEEMKSYLLLPPGGMLGIHKTMETACTDLGEEVIHRCQVGLSEGSTYYLNFSADSKP